MLPPLRVFSSFRSLLVSAVLASVLGGCTDEGEGAGVAFVPASVEAEATRPGFSTTTALVLRNNSSLTWQLTALSVDAGEDALPAFVVGPADESIVLPVDLAPGAALDLLVAFEPQLVQRYESLLSARLWLRDFEVGGGGCSAGCGDEAPESSEILVTAALAGQGDEDADFEDCSDGEDNDGDELIDCADGDCAFDPACTEEPEEICDSGVDEDGDGLIDCDDPDCASDPTCLPIEGCDVSGPVVCESDLSSTTRNRTNTFESYCGEGQALWDGGEEIWAYTAENDGPVTVAAFAPWDLDMTVLALELGPDGTAECDPDRCVAQAWGPPGQDEVATFDAEAGSTYLIVIDGFDGGEGPYQLFVTCGAVETDCGDGLDDDADGLTDCEDEDCRFDPLCTDEGCAPSGVLTCGTILTGANGDPGSTNAVDEWCDFGQGGWTGPETVWTFFPQANGPVTVTMDASAGDLDLTVLIAPPGGPGPNGGDCNPELCVADDWGPTGQETVTFDAFVGSTYLIAIDGWDGAESPFTLIVDCAGGGVEVDCGNLVDDDGDGLADCADADCAADPLCFGFGETCDNGLDDDGDGLTDCDDVIECNTFPGCDFGGGDCCADHANPGCDNDAGEDCVCAIDPFCCQVQWDALCVQQYEQGCGGTCGGGGPEVDCADLVDNDNDGLVDCSDADCGTDPGCVGPAFEFSCFNFVDDDFDGLTDCADSDCAAEPICQTPGTELFCDNGLDDDLDFLIDCLDPDCAADPLCGPIVGENCTNGVDDDGDGAADCVDTECIFLPVCDAGDGDCCAAHGNAGCSDEPGEDCVCTVDPFCCNGQWDALCADQYVNQCGGTCAGTEVCGNGLDDDFDGAADCADVDCASDPGCGTPQPETACNDGADNDGDGAVDCADTDCAASPFCAPLPNEIFCADLVDNDLDGFVDCADTDCFGQASCSLPPESNCDNGIDDDADGMTDCVDPNCATSPDCADGEDVCDDGIDNDGDALIDCIDDDCSGNVACVDPGQCSPIGQLSCGDVLSGSNTMPGSTDDDEIYCGYNPGGWFGDEVAWVFTPDADGLVEITLTGLSADLDIMALVQDNGCDPNDCEANGWNPPPQPESMDWYAFEGTPYYIVIDGWQGASSNFTMTVTCTPSDEQDCGDGVDEDQDGDLDCADVDCLGSPLCPETQCANLIDDDADGNADCGDPDCFLAANCLPEAACDDGADNDIDGAIDCADSDCFGQASCASNDCCTVSGAPGCNDATSVSCVCAFDNFCCTVSWDAICVSEFVSQCGGTCSQPEVCTDFTDNDLDGFVDCADSDCALDPFCASATEICGNLADDDGDGFTDCDDSECAATPGCLPGVEQCGNGLDDDGDLAIDCLDTDCSGSPVCLGPEVCGDGIDNDLDGDEDCFDTDCAGDATCLSESDCGNNFDDDADSEVDCDDTDCLGAPGCPVVLFSSVDDDPADFVFVPEGNHASATVWEQGVPNTSAQSGNGPSSARTGTLAWCTGCATPVVQGGRFNGWIVANGAPIDLSSFTTGTLTLQWHHWQVSPGLPFVDLSRVGVSTDGGANTTIVWGPNAASTGGWLYQELDLTAYVGTQLLVGFRYDSLSGFGGGAADGWYVEDVELIWTP